MKVLFAAAEAAPFAKTGGLGDVVGSLPLALRKRGVDARVILPKYGHLAGKYRETLNHRGSYTVPLGWRRQYVGLEEVEYRGVPFYFVDNEYYFKRDGLYGYYDDGERFAYFCRAVLKAAVYLDFKPDVIHCNDWHSALIPVFLDAFYREDEVLREIKTLLTIHNLRYQGVFSHFVLGDILDLSERYDSSDKLEYYGQINYLKGGLALADRITTVSPNYAREIQGSYGGEGLDGFLRSNAWKMEGILNGIDYEEYNPRTDPYLDYQYGDPLPSKAQNKSKLQQRLGLPVNKDIPMLGMVSRLTEQKGLDLLLCMMEEIMACDLQMVVLGTGEDHYQKALAQTSAKYPHKIKYLSCFDEAMARRIYGASDIFLMPSLFEPCGISQLIALRYGSVPLVRETGGLKDTVRPYNEFTGEGNGFSFSNFNAHEFFHVLKIALKFYQNKEAWGKIVASALATDFSWDISARRYAELYSELGGH